MRIPKTPRFGRRGQPRRRVTPLWRSRATLAAAAALIVFAGVGGGWWLWQGGLVAGMAERLERTLIAGSVKLDFTVQEVLVIGRRETSKADLLAAVGLTRGAPILAFDLRAARRRVEALPWISTASVERILPDTVVLRIVERRPLALWQNQGRFALIDDEGAVILKVGLERFSDLPLVVGEDAPAHAAEILQVLETQPQLVPRVKAAVRVGKRRWNVRFHNGIDVRLPEENAASAWARLAEYQRTHRVLAPEVRVLDLRLPGRLILRRSPWPARSGAAPRRET